jgi:hypothetical protein
VALRRSDRAQQKPADFRCGSAYPSDDKLKELARAPARQHLEVSLSVAGKGALIFFNDDTYNEPAAYFKKKVWCKDDALCLQYSKNAGDFVCSSAACHGASSRIVLGDNGHPSVVPRPDDRGPTMLH